MKFTIYYKEKTMLLIIMLLAIGFATVTTLLNINGPVGISINEDDFDVIFTDSYVEDNKGISLINEDAKKIIFKTSELKKVDEKSVLSFTITNTSKSYDAEGVIDCHLNSVDDSNLVNISYNKKVFDIKAGESDDSGKLTVTLLKNVIEEKELLFECEFVVNAKERTSLANPIEVNTYSMGAYLLDSNDNPLIGKKLAVYSNTPHFVTTDENGYFYVENLEYGSHEIYYLGENSEDLTKKTKSEIKELALDKASVTTNTSITKIGTMKLKNFIIDKTKDLKVVSINKNNLIKKIIIEGNTYEFNVSDLNNYSNVYSSNNSQLEINGSKVIIKNITQSTDVIFGNSLLDSINSFYSSNNYLIQLKDENLSQKIRLVKNMFIDLNGKTLNFDSNESSNVFDMNSSTVYMKNGKIDVKKLGKYAVVDCWGKLTLDNVDISISESTNQGFWIRDNAVVTLKNLNYHSNGGLGSVYSINDITKGGEFNIINVNATGNEVANLIINPHNGTINITSSNITSHNALLTNESTGTININSGYFKSDATLIVNNGKGTININGGNFENGTTSSNNIIKNNGEGTINIEGEKAKFDSNGNYVSGIYLHKNNIGHIIHIAKGNITIEGGTFHSFFTDSVGSCNLMLTGPSNAIIKDGIFKNEKDINLYTNNTSVLKVYGGDYYSKSHGNVWHHAGTVYLYDGNYLSEVGSAVHNFSGVAYIYGGTYKGIQGIGSTVYQESSGAVVNVCGGSFTGTSRDIYITDSAAKVNYTSNVKWTNNNINPVLAGTFGSNAKLNNATICP